MRVPAFTFPGRQFINFTTLLIGTWNSLLVIMGTRQLLKTQIVSQVHRNQAEEKEISNVGGDSGAPLCLSI